MDKFKIVGGVELDGELPVSGSKNSALPALAACLLTEEPVILRRVPNVKDIFTMQELLRHTGARVCEQNGRVCIDASVLERPEAPYEVVKTMRASSLVLGPLVARTGGARVSMPGGCAIGSRPINFTYRPLSSSAQPSSRRTDTWKPAPLKACAARIFISTASPSPELKTC